MVAIYVRLVRSGSMTLESVPALWRAQVEAIVDAAETASADEAATQRAEPSANGAGRSREAALEEENR